MAKVSWVKRVFFGDPMQLRGTPVFVTFRHSSDNTIAPQWKDFEGTELVVGTSKHENGVIKTFVNPGRYSIHINDGSRYVVLENQTVFLDIDQFEEIAEGDVDTANDSVVCYDHENSRYVLTSIADFYNVEVIIPATYNGRILAARGSNQNALGFHGCGRLFDYPVYITAKFSDQLVSGDNWIHEVDQFKNVNYVSLGNGNVFAYTMYGDIDIPGVPVSKAGNTWGIVNSAADIVGSLPYTMPEDTQGRDGIVVSRDGLIVYIYTNFGTVGTIAYTNGTFVNVSDYVLMTIRNSSEFVGLSKNGLNIGRINLSGTVLQEWTLSTAWHDEEDEHVSWDYRGITYDQTTDRLWLFDPFNGRYLLFDLSDGSEIERGVFPTASEVRAGSDSDRTLFQVRGSKIAQFIRGVNASIRPIIQYYDHIGVSNFSYSTSTTYDD